MSAAPKFTPPVFPVAVLADGALFGFARNRRELEAAFDQAARPYVKVTTRPALYMQCPDCPDGYVWTAGGATDYECTTCQGMGRIFKVQS